MPVASKLSLTVAFQTAASCQSYRSFPRQTQGVRIRCTYESLTTCGRKAETKCDVFANCEIFYSADNLLLHSAAAPTNTKLLKFCRGPVMVL